MDQQYGILAFYVMGYGRKSYLVDWYGNRASRDMPRAFAVRLQRLRNAKAQS